ncbi:MAG: hypothetical protein H3C31_11700 [Brumimicrobium sp.]|nr:hypothetical protein [Brumimicrobium sp.]MCO5268678.1 hypothetical protein [Brumimicrobium sp.]
MRLSFIALFILLGNIISHAQNHGFIAGYNVGLYTYSEAYIENLTSKFNHGWSVLPSDNHKLLIVKPNTIVPGTLTKAMKWDRINTGIKLGWAMRVGGMGSRMFTVNLYFQGATNSAKGQRGDEELEIKSKHGGIYVDVNASLATIFRSNSNFLNHILIGYEMGTTVYKLKYSYKSTTYDIKNVTMGNKHAFLGRGSKSKSWNFSFGFGLTIRLLETRHVALDIKSSYLMPAKFYDRYYEVDDDFSKANHMFRLSSLNNSFNLSIYL